VLIVEDVDIAGRFLDQWGKLVAAGDKMPASLKAENSKPTIHSEGYRIEDHGEQGIKA
jgi:hypothetical protein